MGVVYDYMLDEVRTDGGSGGSGGYPVPPCSNIRCLQQGETTVRIKWDDPEDLTVDGVALAEWGSCCGKLAIIRQGPMMARWW